jgi:hypothetical protein
MGKFDSLPSRSAKWQKGLQPCRAAARISLLAGLCPGCGAAHKGIYARLRGLCGAVLRWSGTIPNVGVWNDPGSAAYHQEVLRSARDKSASES